jgi:hypothetical protein
MSIIASLLGVVLSLVPVVVLLALRARRDRPLWALALDVPLAVALDLLVVLSLSRFMRVEIATFVSRGLWLGALAAVLARRSPDGPAWPSALGRYELKTAGAGALVGLALSAEASWPYSIWDRRWHIPVVSSLRGQMLPFENAVAKGEVLHYHFAGDLYAAMMQSLSLGVPHSSLALSVSHDLLFTLTGAALVLLFSGLGGRHGALVGIAVTFAALLSGPLSIGRDAQPNSDGYSVINFLSMSFRPHDAVAGLLFVGFVGSVVARVWRRSAPVHEGGSAPEPPKLADTAPALLGAAAGLALSDETTLGMLGLSLGLVWIVWPDVVHPRRGPGVLLFVGLFVALVAPNLAFAAALAPGAQHHAIRLVPWRSPGCYKPTLLLSTAQGVRMLVFDALPTVTAWLGGLAAFAWRRRPRSGPIVALFTLVVVFSWFALTRVDVDGQALESHRFVNGIQFLAPLFAATLLIRAPDEAELAESPTASLWARARHLAPAALTIMGAGLGAASTIWWIADALPRRGHHHNHFDTKQDLYALDCRKELGGTLGAAAVPYYVSQGTWYAYTGCQPAFAPAHNDNYWAVTIGKPYYDKAGLKVLSAGMAPGDRLPVICPRPLPAKPDQVCAWATAHAHCEDLGTAATRCTLDASERAAALAAPAPRGGGAERGAAGGE